MVIHHKPFIKENKTNKQHQQNKHANSDSALMSLVISLLKLTKNVHEHDESSLSAAKGFSNSRWKRLHFYHVFVLWRTVSNILLDLSTTPI